MSTAVTRGIRVTVRAQYLPERSSPKGGQYAFAYTVRIANEGEATAQLRTRHWVITDGEGKVQEVRGEGVVGEKPILKPGQAFEYTSWCMLRRRTDRWRELVQMATPTARVRRADRADAHQRRLPYSLNCARAPVLARAAVLAELAAQRGIARVLLAKAPRRTERTPRRAHAGGCAHICATGVRRTLRVRLGVGSGVRLCAALPAARSRTRVISAGAPSRIGGPQYAGAATDVELGLLSRRASPATYGCCSRTAKFHGQICPPCVCPDSCRPTPCAAASCTARG